VFQELKGLAGKL